MKKRIVSLILAVLMLLPTAVSCSKDKIAGNKEDDSKNIVIDESYTIVRPTWLTKLR